MTACRLVLVVPFFVTQMRIPTAIENVDHGIILKRVVIPFFKNPLVDIRMGGLVMTHAKSFISTGEFIPTTSTALKIDQDVV